MAVYNQLELIEDWEDGDTTVASSNWNGWTGDTGWLTFSGGDSISGTTTARLWANGTVTLTVDATRPSPVTPDRLEFKAKWTTDSGSYAQYGVRLFDGNGTELGYLTLNTSFSEFRWETPDGTTTAFSTGEFGTAYTFGLDFDWANNQLTIFLDGTEQTTTAVNANANPELGAIQKEVSNGESGTEKFLYTDDIATYEKTVAPEAPTTATQTVEGDGQIKVDATESSSGGDYDNYRIEVSEDGGSYTHVSSPSSMPYTYTATESVDTHRFRVRGENAAGNSDWTYTATKSTDITSSTLSNTSATSFDFSWDGVDDATGYDVLLAELSGSTEGDYTVDQSVSGTSATVSGLENGETYYARPIARYPAGDSLGPEQSTTTSLPAPSLDSLDASTEDEITVSWTKNDNNTGGRFEIWRATQADVRSNGSIIAEVDQSTTTFTDTGLDDGTTYHYLVVRVTTDDDTVSGPLTTYSDSGELSATTVLPAASSLSTGDPGDTSIPVSWTVNADTGTQAVQYKPTSSSTWQTYSSDLGLSTTSETIDGLRTGEAYDLRVITNTSDTSATSASVAETTTLPDEDQPTLGNGVEDEVAIDRGSAVSNYGSVRIQIRETGESSWDSNAVGFAEFIGNYDTLSMAFVGREDGEEYEVRSRVETEHRIGEWTSPTSIIAKFPGAANPSVDAVDSTSVTVGAQDNADNETGFRLEREELVNGEWADRRVVAERGPHSGEGSISITDDTATPSREYRYRVEAYTEHANAYSAWTASTETPSLDGVASERSGSRGWRIRVTHADGSVHRPRVLEATPRQQVNGLPRLEVRVPRDDKWQASGFEDATARAYYHGSRQPVDELVTREQTPEATRLVFEGATALRETIKRDVVEAEADNFIRDLIPTETPYSAVVDEPTGTREEDVPQSFVDTQSDFEARLAATPSVDEPAAVTSDGVVKETRTLDIAIASADGSIQKGSAIEASIEQLSDRYIDSEVYVLGNTDANATLETTLGLEHDAPNGRGTVAVRVQSPDTHHTGFQVLVDDSFVEEIPPDYFYQDEQTQPRWLTIPGLSGTLAAGDHTVRIEPTSNPDTTDDQHRVLFDAIALHDSDYYDGLSTSVSDGWGVGPRTHAADYQAEFSDVTPTKSVVGGWVSVSMSSTKGQQAVALSRDSGATWRTASNTSSFETDWQEPSATLRARVTLSSHNVDDNDVRFTRQTGHQLDIVELYADLQDIPILVNEAYDDTVLGVMQTVAEDTESVFEARIEDGSYVIHWTQPGQRPYEGDLDVINFSYQTDTAARVQRARVYGSSREFSETITASHGEEVALTHSPLVDASERVEDPDSGEVFEYGSDYVPRGNASTIETLSTGDISDGQQLRITYEYSLSGEYTSASAGDDPREDRFDFNIPTERGCGQAARYLVQELHEPVVEATLDVSTEELGWQVINALDPDVIPGDPMQIRDLQQEGGQVTMQLENRQSAGEIVGDLERRLTSNTRQV